ncbi:MAG: HXXEE domain-containing protein [Ruminococcus sp.]|nr:HXXEE domain-containing protein [Ruminococcus sp.]
MKEYLLLLPIIFIFHDMEEIIGFGWFFRRNPELFRRHPRLTATYRGFTNEGFAAAVYEEFIPFFGVTLLAYYFPGRVLYALWFGMMLSLTGHFIAHIGICAYVGKFIPSLITSLICLPVSAVILVKTSALMTFDALTVSLNVMAVLAMMLNMKLAHGVMHLCNRRFGSGTEE